MDTKRSSLFNLIFVLCHFISLSVYLILINFILSPIFNINLNNFSESNFCAFNRIMSNPVENVIKYYNTIVAYGTLIVAFCLAILTTFFVGLYLPYAIKKIVAVTIKKSNKNFVNSERVNESSTFNFFGAIKSNTVLLKTAKLSM